MEIRKDWVNTLGLMFMAYATITDGRYSPEEKVEVLNQFRRLCDHINSTLNTGEQLKISYPERISEITKWYMQLKFEKHLEEEFLNISEHLDEQDFWSGEISVKVCASLYQVANADNNVVIGEADVLTDLMEKWEVSIQDIENELQN